MTISVRHLKIAASIREIFLLSLGFLVVGDSIAAADDKLIIIGDVVNLRSAPSIDADILLKLLKNHKVTEIQRQNNWVEIKTHREDIKTAWIHKSLVSKATVSKNTSSPTRFDRFIRRFNEHNDNIKRENGVIYFSEAKNNGQGEIEVIANKAWLSTEHDARSNALNEIFKLWSDVTPVGNSISLRVFDKQGKQHTLMLR